MNKIVFSIILILMLSSTSFGWILTYSSGSYYDVRGCYYDIYSPPPVIDYYPINVYSPPPVVYFAPRTVYRAPRYYCPPPTVIIRPSHRYGLYSTPRANHYRYGRSINHDRRHDRRHR